MDAPTLSRVVPLFLAALLSTSAALASTYVVKPDGTGDFPTIQAAIDACVNGDVVELTDGIFAGDGNRDISYLGKAITVRSQSGDPQTCVVDCEGSLAEPHRGFNFEMNEGPESRLERITLMNGWIAGPGGAVKCDHVAATFADCVFSDNAAGDASGGGAYVYGGSPTFTGCVFSDNSADECGGAAYLRGGAPTFGDCVFASNSSAAGGGLWCMESSASFIGCAFNENRASAAGGAVWSWPFSSNTFADCTFDGNTASGDAGAVACDFSTDSFVDCSFDGNAAPIGGAARLREGSPNLSHCVFTRNRASDLGGAVYCREDAARFSNCTFRDNAASRGGTAWCWQLSSSTFTHCTFVGNSATEFGDLLLDGFCGLIDNCTFHGAVGGCIDSDNSSWTMENTIIAFSTQGLGLFCDARSTIILTCCDIFGNEGGDWTGYIANQLGVNGNICQDPLFCDPPGGDYRLQSGSPCAPFTPPNPECDLIGALPVGCAATAVEPSTWGAIKASFN